MKSLNWALIPSILIWDKYKKTVKSDAMASFIMCGASRSDFYDGVTGSNSDF